jgi:integrase
MPIDSLSDIVIKKARPRDKAYKIFDGAGLFIIVGPTGHKWWRFKYKFGGREKLLSVGIYPDVPLKLARVRRDEARKLVAAGVDPSIKRKSEKVAQANTFKALAEEWLTHESKTLSASTIRMKRARLEKWAYGPIGNMPITDIEPPELLAMLKRVEATGRHETAHRVRQAVGGVFQYAILTHRAKRDSTADLRGALVPVVEAHHAGLTDPQAVGALLRAIDSYHGQPVSEIALRLTPLLFVRPGELRKAEWKEFDLTGAEPIWRIPAAKMKMKREHLVPLARQAVALLREAEKHTYNGKYVFPTSHDPLRPMSENTIRGALRALGYSSDVHTPHGFRTTASTLLNERGFNPELVEMQLAHEERSESRAAYNRSQKLKDRRVMMQDWADYLDQLRDAPSKPQIERI